MFVKEFKTGRKNVTSHIFWIYLALDRSILSILSGSRADDRAGFTFTTSLMLHILLPPPFCYPRFLPHNIFVYSELCCTSLSEFTIGRGREEMKRNKLGRVRALFWVDFYRSEFYWNVKSRAYFSQSHYYSTYNLMVYISIHTYLIIQFLIIKNICTKLQNAKLTLRLKFV